MSFTLLLESALRALGLGAGIWVLMRLVRLRDASTETLVWTVVLLLALAMPMLMPALERWSPALAFHLPPRLSAAMPAALDSSGPHAATEGNWLGRHDAALLWSLYFLFAAMGLARLAIGLVLTARLYCRAQPVSAAWAQGRVIRASDAIAGPLAFGAAILLPADYPDWPQAKLAAVLAHEQCHVQRGDFFIQLLASLYRALFWFSPFAWWLQRHLRALAETASDAAAVHAAGDPAAYAEILLDVSRHARGLGAVSVAMAKGPDIAWRIDRILDGTTPQTLGWRLRAAAVATVLPAALAISAIHAAPVTAVLPRIIVAGTKPAAATPIAIPPAPAAATFHPARAARPGAPYDPRALLRNPTAMMVRGLIVTTNG